MNKLDVTVGEQVVWHHRIGKPTVTKVDRITPSGIIVTQHGQMWNPDGYKRGEDRRWGRDFIEKMTEEYRVFFHRARLVETLKLAQWSDYPTETLEQFMAMVHQAEQMLVRRVVAVAPAQEHYDG